jgi:hypothetical protein
LDSTAITCPTGGSGVTSLTLNPTQQNSLTMFNSTQAINGTVQDNWLTWNTAIASYNGPGRPSGKSNLTFDWYEGSLEAEPPRIGGGAGQVCVLKAGTAQLCYTSTLGITPTTANITGTTHGNTIVDSLSSITNVYAGMSLAAGDLTTETVASVNKGCPGRCVGNYMVISSNAGGSHSGEAITVTGNGTSMANAMTDAVAGWKNSSLARATMKYYYQSFAGTDPNAFTFNLMSNANSPSSLLLLNSNPWALYPGTFPGIGLEQTPYKTYNGVCAFNEGSC